MAHADYDMYNGVWPFNPSKVPANMYKPIPLMEAADRRAVYEYERHHDWFWADSWADAKDQYHTKEVNIDYSRHTDQIQRV